MSYDYCIWRSSICRLISLQAAATFCLDPPSMYRYCSRVPRGGFLPASTKTPLLMILQEVISPICQMKSFDCTLHLIIGYKPLISNSYVKMPSFSFSSSINRSLILRALSTALSTVTFFGLKSLRTLTISYLAISATWSADTCPDFMASLEALFPASRAIFLAFSSLSRSLIS